MRRRTRTFRLFALLLVPLFGFGLTSCSEDGGPPPVEVIQLINSLLQGTVGGTVTAQVQILDANMTGIGGVTVTLSPSAGSVSSSTVTSDAQGNISASWTLGTSAGQQTLTVSAGGKSATVTAQVSPGPAAEVATQQNTTIQDEAGSDQTISVTIRDQFGNVRSGDVVRFVVTAGGGSVSPSQATTNGQGQASTTWTLGGAIGTNTLRVESGNASTVQFTATTTAGPPSAATLVAGDGQSGTVGQLLGNALVVEVTDAFGNPTPGASVSFEPANGSGTVSTGTTQADNDGRASTTWTLGSVSGTQTVNVIVGGNVVASFTAAAGPGAPAAIMKVGGDTQSQAASSILANDPTVQVNDGFGNPVPNVTVTFVVLQGGGSLSAGAVVTGANGQASVSWTLGATPGTNIIQASVAGVVAAVTFTATGQAPNPATLTKIQGDNQNGTPNAPVGSAPAVEVLDANGLPVPGVTVTFAVTSGGGSASGAVQTTNTQGRAQVGSWVLGPAEGTNTLTATVASLPAVTFTATATSNSAFNIEVRFVGATQPTQAQRNAFAAAEARWQGIITGDLVDILVTGAAGACGVPHPAINEVVDDLLIFAEVTDIDGVNGILGQAGWCARRPSGSTLPVAGLMQFDIADLQNLENLNLLVEVIVHEMGHVLGLGGLWDDFGLGTGFGTANPQYTGAAAVQQYQNLGGAGNTVAIENEGGQGTADVHWEEKPEQGGLNNELMTGTINLGVNPLTAITIGSLIDLGYQADVNQGDSFTVPVAAAATPGEAAAQLIRIRLNSILRGSSGIANPDGSVTIVPMR